MYAHVKTLRPGRFVTLCTALAMTLILALPAQAAWVTQESGTIACGTNNIAVRVRHSAHGSAVDVPVGTLRDYNWTGQGTATWTETTLVSGTKTWKAWGYSGGLIDTVGTYAFCWGN